MKFELKYGDQPIVLPSIPEQTLLAADAAACRLLLLLASEPSLRVAGRDALANRLDLTPGEADAAIAFWQSHGVLKKTGTKKVESGEKKNENTPKTNKSGEKISPEPGFVPKKTKVSELPSYTDSELAAILEDRAGLTDLITEAQNALGKIFNVSETKILVSIVRELGFDEEFMLILLDFCRQSNRASLRYVEKLAVALYDDGVRDAEALTAYLRRREQLAGAEGRIRTMFGLGSRALTERERGYIAAWTETYGFDDAMIAKAYEITVNSTSKPSLSYANRILENWYTEGKRTPEEVDAARAERKGVAGSSVTTSSFDVNDFFKAAVDRSYSDD